MKIQKVSDKQTGLLPQFVVHFGNRVALEKTFKQDQPKIGMDIVLLTAVFDRCYQTALVEDRAADVVLPTLISFVFRP